MAPFYKISQGWRETCFDTWDRTLQEIQNWVEHDKDHAVTVCIIGTKGDVSEAEQSKNIYPTCAECGSNMIHSRLHGYECIRDPRHQGIVRP